MTEKENGSFSGMIHCIVGKSASGKDTVYNRVLSLCKSPKLIPVILYTTRPIRTGEQDGKDYFFIDDKTFEDMLDSGKIIEYRSYETEYGSWKYAIADDGQINCDNHYILIDTPEGICGLEKRFGKEYIDPIYIVVDDGTRLLRALTREMQQTNPRYDEMCRRFLSDSKDFKDYDTKDDITKIYNETIEKCSEEIIAHISEKI